jgi:hypothetical protein
MTNVVFWVVLSVAVLRAGPVVTGGPSSGLPVGRAVGGGLRTQSAPLADLAWIRAAEWLRIWLALPNTNPES